MLDLLLTGGRIVDGTGSPWYRGDVGVEGGRIVAIGTLPGAAARVRVAVDGLVVAPGFIDVHAHSDIRLLVDPAWEVKTAQGVTTEVLGQDGLAVAPLNDRRVLRRTASGRTIAAFSGSGWPPTWSASTRSASRTGRHSRNRASRRPDSSMCS